MSVWFALWALVSIAILSFSGWTFYILFRQKAAWKAFAARNGLAYKAGAMMTSPEMNGSIEGYKFSFFTGEHMAQDLRSTRKMTAVEITLRSVLPLEGAVASGGMVPLVKALGFGAEILPRHESWNPACIAAGSNRFSLQAYLTDERVSALSKLMQARNVWVILIFRNDVTLLRVDTPGALETAEKLEKIKKALLAAAQIFEMKSGEASFLKTAETDGLVRESSLKLEDEDFSAASGLRLEDEPDAGPATEDGPGEEP